MDVEDSARIREQRCLREKVYKHTLVRAPEYCGKYNDKIRKWTRVKSQYQQSRCSGCGKQTRTYCECTICMFLCTNCFPLHVVEDVKS